MADYFAFNGDADGLCALQQLRLAEAPENAALITGPKRDIELLKRVDAGAGDRVTVLDVSHDKNRADVARLLAAGAELRYFDHHYAGALPDHPRFAAHIDTGADVCTSALVNAYLGGRHVRWAVAAAFGDELPQLGQALAQRHGVDAETLEALARLGRYLNYNGYGESVADLYFDPAQLADEMLPYADPLAFIAGSRAFAALHDGYSADMALAGALTPEYEAPGVTLLRLPDAPWARRVIGVLANQWTRKRPDHALAVLSPKSGGGFVVSVRTSPAQALGADDFCRGFDTGGGRKRAGGINHLPESGLDDFIAAFVRAFGGSSAGREA